MTNWDTYDRESPEHQAELLAYAEGRLHADAAARIERLLATSEACRDDLAWLKAIHADLTAMGDAEAVTAPHVDLVDGVMAAVAAPDAAPDTEDLLAYLDGSLERADSLRVSRYVESSDETREELHWLTAVHRVLTELGATAEAHIGDIDLVDSVMSAVSRATTPGKVVSIDAAHVKRRAALRWASVAAAALLLIAGGLTAWNTWHGDDASGPVRIVQTPDDPDVDGPAVPDAGPGDQLAASKQLLDDQIKRLASIAPVRPESDGIEAIAPPDIALLKTDDIVEARRNAAEDPNGWAKLLQWASLTPEQAATVAESADATPAAVVGVAADLAPDEAEELLLTAVGHFPEDPYVRFALVKTTSVREAGLEASAQAALGQVALLRQLDPDNALSYYLEAKLLLDAGDTEGALMALSEARSLDEASAYSLESAAYRREALVSNGLEPEAAELLAALTAGMDEYEFLTELGSELLEYGEAHWEAGDVDSAEEIFGAVQTLGEQLEEGAVLLQEQLAALDIERAAIEMLEGLYIAIESVEGIETLTAQTMELMVGLESISELFQVLDTLFFSEGDGNFFNMISSIILQEGDLSLFERLELFGDRLQETADVTTPANPAE
ncbi:MAG: hypothetical protein GY851_14975 [bacterium]|nr:hypothetical protein [bacterium]